MKVLVAVDSSEASNKAVAFAGRILGKRPERDVSVTLIHVVESLPDFILARSGQPDPTGAYRHVADEWTASDRRLGETLLADMKQTLVNAGVPAADIHAKLVEKEGRPEARRVVASLAIIEEMQRGNFDVVVLGRRGTSGTIETFVGTVAEKVAREACGRTLWIVD